MYRLTNLARVAALALAGAVTACSADRVVLGSNPPSGGEIFKSYVALGNSITAGYQSSGINDSTQRQSYARLLAAQMGTQYHYAALSMPGCPAPVANFQTQARVLTGLPTGTTTPPPCSLRTSSSITDVLNNVAVPGAVSFDPVSLTSPASNPYTTFILGGKTQVGRALQAKPTFATIWIGNNDVLGAGASGILVPTPALGQNGILSTLATFMASYDAMIKQLVDSAPGLKGVLIGVGQVGGLPLLSSGDTLFRASAANRAVMNAIAGTTVTVDPACSGSSVLVNVPSLLGAVRAGQHPAFISCTKNVPVAPVGDIFVLDVAEQATLKGVIDSYNAYLSAKAAAIGFAYYDPNPLLAANRATNAIPRFPNFTSATATFGALVSLDGFHPALGAHKLIANALIPVINAKYGTSLQPVP
ncbi:MAG: SGNH/GDSL hydrolase family protein [Gemmatimonadaceae bacterium]